ncbi:hypothetical protein QJS10_CPB12g01196 [Acorus calamus]|uniref:Uncharacterized protein n=1 Tax=Acorus calamus TaxID=4465 RepID=A0AAV9DNF0_ACOCL|nr:hypothetical protein QJS10_CPB12g01196 [Acorus calamus]
MYKLVPFTLITLSHKKPHTKKVDLKMASQPFVRFRTSTIICCFFLYLCLSPSLFSFSEAQTPKQKLSSNENDGEEVQPKQQQQQSSKPTKKLDMVGKKNQTKPIKPKSNSTTPSPPKTTITPLKTTKFPKPSNSTKPLKLPTNSTKSIKTNSTKSIKTTSNSTKPIKTTSTNSIKPIKISTNSTKSQKSIITTKSTTAETTKPKPKAQPKPIYISTVFNDEDGMDGDDLISEFRDLPSKFQQTLLPDLEKMSTTSKAYLTKANREMTKNFKPIVGNKYAPTIASLISCIFLILPLLLLSLVFHQIKTYLSLPRMLLFIQAYLAIYFGILSITSLFTGLEPLKLFYATSPTSYVYTQVLQTLGYVLYLLMQLMNLIVVFSTAEIRLGSKALGLAQVFVGLSVGLHYYAAVFHRAVLREPPKTNWKIHAVYSLCFLVICAFARVDRRKKAYEGGEDGKKS